MISLFNLILLGGVIFSVSWHIYKAVQYDAERLDSRVKYLEDSEFKMWKKIRRLNNGKV